jgi:hypothetical protein
MKGETRKRKSVVLVVPSGRTVGSGAKSGWAKEIECVNLGQRGTNDGAGRCVASAGSHQISTNS